MGLSYEEVNSSCDSPTRFANDNHALRKTNARILNRPKNRTENAADTEDYDGDELKTEQPYASRQKLPEDGVGGFQSASVRQS